MSCAWDEPKASVDVALSGGASRAGGVGVDAVVRHEVVVEPTVAMVLTGVGDDAGVAKVAPELSELGLGGSHGHQASQDNLLTHHI